MTLPHDIHELIHADLDGMATERDRARLREILLQNPAARGEYERLRRLGGLLDAVEREEPPAELVERVMGPIRTGELRRPASFASRLGRPQGRVVLRYAYALAAGVLLGMIGLYAVTGRGPIGQSVSSREAAATLAPGPSSGGLQLSAAGVHGTATMRPAGSGAAIDVDLKASEPVEVILRFDPREDGGRLDVRFVHEGETTEAGSLRLPKQ
ncbi:MAG TPA: hypothetical protein VFB67_13370 [Candidatus Polarisedimenticolaceae bacterium]|nr:hypothetical protein [Candidatus Polarisedimenticolaceae bacterium]